MQGMRHRNNWKLVLDLHPSPYMNINICDSKRDVLKDRPDIIKRNKYKICLLAHATIPSDMNLIQKQTENIYKIPM